MKLGKKLYRGAIMIDIDGVIADFELAFCDAFGFSNRHLYDLWDRYPSVSSELITEFVNNPDNYRNLVPIFGGVLLTRQAYERGWYVILCTSRNRHLEDVTIEWLNYYGNSIKYHELSFTEDKGEFVTRWNNQKSDKIKIVVDDNVRVLDNGIPENVLRVAWAQEWNEEYYPRMWYNSEDMEIYLSDGVTTNGIWRKVK